MFSGTFFWSHNSLLILREEVTVSTSAAADSTVKEMSEDDSDVSSSQIPDGYLYVSQAHPSEDYFLTHPEVLCPPVGPHCIEIHYRTGENDYENFPAALVLSNKVPDSESSLNLED